MAVDLSLLKRLDSLSSSTARATLLALCQAAVSGPQDDLLDMLMSQTSAASLREEDMQSMLCDTIAIIWCQVEATAHQANLASFLRQLCNRQVIPTRMARARLEPTLLERAMVIPSAEQAKRKDIVWRTHRLYTQTKYNLLREETEGFSKVLVELSGECRPQRIQALIGAFDLDPNRVADLLLQTMFNRGPDSDDQRRQLLLQLVQSRSTLTALLGNAFKHSEPSSSMFDVAADLIERGTVDAVDLFSGYLLPNSIDDLVKIRTAIDNQIRDTADSLSHVNLNADRKGGNMEKPYSPISLSDAMWTTPCPKLDLISALFRNGGKSAVDAAWRLLAACSTCLPSRYVPVSDALAGYTERLIWAFYRQHCSEFFRLNSGNREEFDETMKTETLDSVIPHLDAALRYLGPQLYRHTVLFVRLCRSLHAYLQSRSEDDAFNAVSRLLCQSILPAYSLMPGTCGTAAELHRTLQCFPYQRRFALYHTWLHDIYAAEEWPELNLALRTAQRHTKYFRKRIIAGKVKEVGRQLPRFSHNAPLVVMQLVVAQIQAFDNLSAPAVDSFKYLTALSHDTLPYTIIAALSDKKRDPLSEDGQTPAAWFASLCSFTGLLARRYAGQIAVQPLVEYMAGQARMHGRLNDFLLLQELVSAMSTVTHIEEQSGAQLAAQGGSRNLKDQVIDSASKVGKVKRNPQLLVSALQESGLTGQLYIIMAQNLMSLNWRVSPRTALRAMCHQVDVIRQVMMQYREFLDVHLTPHQAYADAVPSLYSLVSTHGLSIELAFAIVRPVLHIDRVRAAPDEDDPSLASCCRHLLPANVWRAISPALFAVFWSLSLYDISVPEDQYRDQQRRIEARINSLASALPSNPAESSAVTERKAAKERERLKRLHERLGRDLEEQSASHVSCLSKIRSEAPMWLSQCAARQATTLVFLERCLIPRVLSSAPDALYAARFVRLMHDLSTPGFSTIKFYNEVVRLLPALLSSCTAHEASRLGRFVRELLEYLTEWGRSVAESGEVHMPSLHGWSTDLTTVQMENVITTDVFGQFVSKWHDRISKSLSRLFRSSDQAIQQAALLFLAQITDHYPRHAQQGQRLLAAVSALGEAHPAGSSIRILSQGVHAGLQRRQSEWAEAAPTEPPAAEAMATDATPAAAAAATPSAAPAPESTAAEEPVRTSTRRTPRGKSPPEPRSKPPSNGPFEVPVADGSAGSKRRRVERKEPGGSSSSRGLSDRLASDRGTLVSDRMTDGGGRKPESSSRGGSGVDRMPDSRADRESSTGHYERERGDYERERGDYDRERGDYERERGDYERERGERIERDRSDRDRSERGGGYSDRGGVSERDRMSDRGMGESSRMGSDRLGDSTRDRMVDSGRSRRDRDTRRRRQ